MDTALVRAYRWAMAPTQENPQQADYGFSIFQTDAVETGEIVNGAFATFIKQEALVESISPISLVSMLTQYVWKNEAYRDHIGIDTLWELMINNVYMHRLRNKTVLMDCIKQGVPDRNFGYAGGYHSEEYQDLRFGESMNTSLFMVADDNLGLLVNSEMAQLVKDETPPKETATSTDDTDTYTTEEPTETDDPVPPPTQRGPRHITATKTMQSDISLDDVNLLREEIIRNLRDDGGEITISITINAKKIDGFSESITRSVRENSTQLSIDFKEKL